MTNFFADFVIYYECSTVSSTSNVYRAKHFWHIDNLRMVLARFCKVYLQWTLVIINFLGPVNLLCYIKILLYLGCKYNKKYKEILNFGTKKVTLLYRDFVILVFFITTVHCISYIASTVLLYMPLIWIQANNIITFTQVSLYHSWMKFIFLRFQELISETCDNFNN